MVRDEQGFAFEVPEPGEVVEVPDPDVTERVLDESTPDQFDEWQESAAVSEAQRVAAQVSAIFGEGPPGRTGPQCHSYSPAGDRCEQDGGHRGDHTVSMSWSDEMAWTPSRVPLQVQAAPGVVYGAADPTRVDLVDVPKPSGKCVICGHRMHTGTCGRPMEDSEHGCDCANGVEE